jgi:hypothetical protein
MVVMGYHDLVMIPPSSFISLQPLLAQLVSNLSFSLSSLKMLSLVQNEKMTEMSS